MLIELYHIGLTINLNMNFEWTHVTTTMTKTFDTLLLKYSESTFAFVLVTLKCFQPKHSITVLYKRVSWIRMLIHEIQCVSKYECFIHNVHMIWTFFKFTFLTYGLQKCGYVGPKFAFLTYGLQSLQKCGYVGSVNLTLQKFSLQQSMLWTAQSAPI